MDNTKSTGHEDADSIENESFFETSGADDPAWEHLGDEDLKERIDTVSSTLLGMLEKQASTSPAASSKAFQDRLAGTCIPAKLHPILTPHAYPCIDTSAVIPPRPPSSWPQRPLLLRPAPESNTRIRGIRYAGDGSAYIPLPGTNYCSGCTLPINNGLEKRGKTLVIDFETELFVGTMMIRVKNANPPLPDADEADTNYFDEKKRTFQAIVRGKFTSPDIPMSECVTGQIFRHSAGTLPPKFVLKGAVRLISTLAPQLQADFDGHQPRFLSPLVSTAQSVIADQAANPCRNCAPPTTSATNAPVDALGTKFRWYDYYPGADQSLEDGIVEPVAADPTSIMSTLDSPPSSSSSSACAKHSCVMKRTKDRKKAFDKLFAKKVKTPTFDTNTVYTFEFYQHMLLFDDFAIDLGLAMGKQKLASSLNGQPLKFMAAHQQRPNGDGGNENFRWLWNFDIWHESLYELAVQNSSGEA